ncbi:family 16 glycosylhydrolase [Flagellimonas sp. S3867]|uniref:glycoside hydrolase family 16 protein n=1 Tax=Flagellimonas sp. S3867 TaxID=2768063 RepID=UPI001687E67C|nr:glycoside hydrolase family 16 protein [Flagellimonas sp. S3867]
MNNSYTYKKVKALQFPSLLFVMLLMVSSCETDDVQTVTTLTNLVMADEFDTEGAPNPSLWTYDLGRGPNGDGWGNQELQYYTDRTENVKVDNGLLLITAQEESFEGASYTSARLVTRGLFEQTYGRFEARIRLPYGKGLWPAFWLLGNDCAQNIWPQCGEIDIMEYLGDSPNVVFGTVHGPGYSAAEGETKEYALEDDRFDTGFHVFGIEWGPDYINYYVDGDLYNQITPDDVVGEWVFDHPFYIILNVAVGGSFPGSPNEETTFPQTMLVDYVRVYENNITD